MAVSSGEMSRTKKAVALVLTVGLGAGAVGAAGCGGGSKSAKPPTPKVAEPFKAKDHESLPAARVPLSPAKMTIDACFKQFWSNHQGDREQPISAQGAPLEITIDGRCNIPLSSQQVGLYAAPVQEVNGLETELMNGQVVGVICQTDGQVIEDVRGSIDASDTWVKVVDRDGDVGDVPTVNAGFPDLAGIAQC